MIESLTKEQEAKFPEYVKKWIAVGLNTDPCDFEKSKEFAQKCYKIAGQTVPKVFFLADCPVSAATIAVRAKEKAAEMRASGLIKDDKDIKAIKAIKKEIDDGVVFDKSKIKDFDSKLKSAINEQIFGSMEAGWLSFYDFFMRECGIKIDKIAGLIGMSNYCGWWSPYSECVIFQHRPKAIRLEDFHNTATNSTEKRLHNTTGPAVEYRGAGLSNVFAVHGARVTKRVIDRTYTSQDIDNEVNAEVRRVMVELYGMNKYILDSGAEEVHTDDFGTLYKKAQTNDEEIWVVKVINSTQESDGSFKEYFIRIDPKILRETYKSITARAAVASTWRNDDGSLLFKSVNDYVPQEES